MTDRAFPHRQQGFSLLELALVIVVMGGVLLVAMHYRAQTLSQDDAIAKGYHDQIAAALYRYAERHYRLPCADTSGNGLEGGSDGICTPGMITHMVGGVPFLTLGMNEAQGFSEAVRQRYIYGVFRDTTPDTDLATLAERTGDAPGTSGYLSLDDLRFALRSLGTRAFDAARIHVTGDEQQAGAADCGANPVANLAFFVAYAGARDADGDGNSFDGVNKNFNWPSGGGLCVSGPLTGQGKQYDDATIAVGFAELLGYLTQ
ncbi:type II secretion system protein [Stutzerimonas sp. NM35]|uniref:type II secretion system protein n=1 Tax=Stutzerimonas stutzeri TaxID=316 RepID=UPI0015E47607|nr:prepilin-type N-terminal cleavage/methylation domain-containing protein [Stutzerimonas stutzeri]MBA1264283.1 prepilin-type N-terminal cleavage/methylation domain-containing protein [Stutzerimonas stutzeri]